MGLLDWIFGKSTPTVQVRARIWMREAFLWTQLAEELQAEFDADRHVVLVSHFPERWEQQVNWLSQQPFPYLDWQPRNLDQMRRELKSPQRRLWLLAVPDFPQLTEEPVFDQEPLSVTVMATEHHPHPLGDRRLKDLATVLPASGGVLIESALDQPLLARICGPLIDVLKVLGMREDDCIESDTVTRQIANRQRQVAGRVPDCPAAESATEWMRLYANEL